MEINPLATSGISADEILTWMRLAGFLAYEVENRYDFDFYENPPRPRPLQRVRQAPERVMDVIFSRVDADELAW
jgi:hypothetical protein